MDHLRLRPARDIDIDAVVEVHLASFPGFFLTTLGRRFLEVFYRSLSSLPQGVLTVAETSGEVVGFVGGTTDQAGLYRAMLRERRMEFVQAAAAAAFRHPSAIPRLIRARLRARGDFDYRPGASLMTLGVSPEFGRRGIGQQLVLAFAATLRARGVEEFSLTTDADHNAGVNRFYRSLGFRLERVLVTREGRRLNEYVRASV